MSCRLTVLLLTLWLAGCGGEPPPLRIGYLGGLSGRTADLGTGGRNGVQLAIDQANAAGGIRGRKVELILKDDANEPEAARHAVQELVTAKVEAIVGPMTSNIAVAVAPLATEAKLLMVAGSVTTNDLTGRDDMFFRTAAASTVHAATMAEYLYGKRRVRSICAAINLSNKAYTESWIANFEKAFSALGGKIHRQVRYQSTPETDFAALTKDLLAERADAVVFVTNAVDTALFANQMRQLGSSSLMVTVEWAGAGKLIELGGNSVEGFVVPQYLDPVDKTPDFAAFQATYKQRFQQEVGFPAVLAYNAARVVLKALAEQQGGESLKQTVLRLRKFEGLQGGVAFDEHGDVQTRTFLTEIRNGQYASLD